MIKKTTLVVLGILLLATMTTAIVLADDVVNDESNIISDGVTIGLKKMDGKTEEEAEKKVERIVDKKRNVNVTIQIGSESANTTLADLGYDWANEDVVDQAIAFGKSGDVIERYKDSLDLKNKGKNFPIKMEFDNSTLATEMRNVCEEHDVEAQNAQLKKTGKGFKVLKEKDGVGVDYKTTISEFKNYVDKEWNGVDDIVFSVTTKIKHPKYTTKDCKIPDDVLGKYTTTFSMEDTKRNQNMKNGMKKLNQHTLYPGETFSCNEYLVPWTKANGWKPAPTYVQGDVEDSLGGGICQVSSTMYNAVIRAELDVVERYPHSLSVGYVDLAADAALADDYKDFKFKNNTKYPIYIQGIYDEGGALTFKIYGHDTRPKNREIEFVSKIVKTTPIKEEVVKDPSKPEGYEEEKNPGHTGYVAKLYKIIYKNGVKVKKEYMHTSTYAMAPCVIIKGTGGSDSDDKDKKKEEESNAAETEQD